MWNGYEWGLFFKNIGKGILWGFGVVVFLILYSLFSETWNCLCSFFCSSSIQLPEVKDSIVLVFGFAISVVIGLVVGIVRATQECRDRKELETQTREQNNYESIITRLLDVEKNANTVTKSVDTYKNGITYRALQYDNQINNQMADSKKLYQTVKESYEKHTEIEKKGESE